MNRGEELRNKYGKKNPFSIIVVVVLFLAIFVNGLFLLICREGWWISSLGHRPRSFVYFKNAPAAAFIAGIISLVFCLVPLILIIALSKIAKAKNKHLR